MNILAKGASARRRRSGFSLVEIAMVLAIVALLVAGIMLFFSNASQAQKTNDAFAEVAAIQQAVASMYSGQPDYTGLANTVLVSSKQLPNKWIKGTGIVNPFGGTVTVAAVTGALGTYSVSFSQVPQAACSKMAATDYGQNLVSVAAGGSTPTALTVPVSPAAAASACSVTASTGNTVTLTFN